MILNSAHGDIGDLYDANDVPISRVLIADTTTGVCTVMLAPIKRGSMMMDPTAVATVTHPAPLKWVPDILTDDNGATI
jgi:hypothetical protein